MVANTDQIKAAFQALIDYEHKSKKGSIDIFENEQSIMMQLTLRYIPKMRSKLVKIVLPSSILRDTDDVCMFVKDLDLKAKEIEGTLSHYKELLAKHNVSRISEIIPLKTLKNEYKPFEAKRKLSNSFAVFLADERILRLLPGLLGKNFYDRCRFPVQVNLESANLGKEIARALSVITCNLSTKGSSFHVTVAHTGMSTSDVIQNIQAALEKLTEAIPGGYDNIRSIFLKTDYSPSLPIYVSEEYTVRVVQPALKKKRFIEEAEDVATVIDAKVLVTKSGKVKIIRNDGLSQKKESKKKTVFNNSVPSNKKRKVSKKHIGVEVLRQSMRKVQNEVTSNEVVQIDKKDKAKKKPTLDDNEVLKGRKDNVARKRKLTDSE